MRQIFARLDEKHNWLGNFLKFFDENSIEKLNFSILWKSSSKDSAIFERIETSLKNKKLSKHFG